MKPSLASWPSATEPAPWCAAETQALIGELWTLRQALCAAEARARRQGAIGDDEWSRSAVNLVHYLELRRHDLRGLQERLSRLGVSSLGRAETHVLANVDKVLGILHRLAGQPWQARSADEPAGFGEGQALLARHAQALFGPSPPSRQVRIMVTLPSAAATDPAFVRALIEGGMDVARINCAHDDADAWQAMARAVRQAASEVGRPVKVMMDLAGPKLRTGPVDSGPGVLRLRPERDAYGRVTRPAVLGLRPHGSRRDVPGAPQCLGVDADWLQDLRAGDVVRLTDARGARRRLRVVSAGADGAVLQARRTAYLMADTVLCRQRAGEQDRATPLSQIPPRPGLLHLARGDRLDLVARGLGRDRQPPAPGRRARPARVACTLPQALRQIRPGDRVWFDDGRIGGVVRRCRRASVEVEITDARETGETLGADKGINLPDTALDLPALTAQDLRDLDVVAACADLVALSFAQSAADVDALQAALRERGAPHLGLVLKIETRRGFEQLPALLMAALRAPAAGVMIARGDLAVECGYERLAEVQEEILWICEAAHLPVVWATQVLESLAKTGLPSRAEITDAAMGGRAECVMLNKGPHILDAMHTLDDVLRRMQHHQSKKRPLLRALGSWTLPASPRAR